MKRNDVAKVSLCKSDGSAFRPFRIVSVANCSRLKLTVSSLPTTKFRLGAGAASLYSRLGGKKLSTDLAVFLTNELWDESK